MRKLVELQPLPVIKSKERRRYGRRATVQNMRKGARARVILSQCFDEDACIRSSLLLDHFLFSLLRPHNERTEKEAILTSDDQRVR